MRLPTLVLVSLGLTTAEGCEPTAPASGVRAEVAAATQPRAKSEPTPAPAVAAPGVRGVTNDAHTEVGGHVPAQDVASANQEACEMQTDRLISALFSRADEYSRCETVADCGSLKLPDIAVSDWSRRHKREILRRTQWSETERSDSDNSAVQAHEPLALRKSDVERFDADVRALRETCAAGPDLPLQIPVKLACRAQSCTVEIAEYPGKRHWDEPSDRNDPFAH